ncbi:MULTISPECIES: RloB family protein [unclassified Sulfurospirillum]|uniref:RloB family protein n=1 Tax=unclassified Sulfurospirillum TaxID=2618290 RepID=UPI0005030ABA|nr:MULTISPECIES: RloB family protein [unclassified Sulfurospirillum]KFL34450.1 hypothetical protein JU57_05405 [Sulfurospirillum sp. SCADC]
MGTDNLHQRAKSTKELGRKKAQRSGDLILIVCEGEKTEPHYIEELLKDLNISNTRAIIEMTGDCGSAPQSVVEKAIERFEAKNYDHIFCIIDRDKHPTFGIALEKIQAYKWKNTNGKSTFKAKTKKAIISIPCFEYWLLLHLKKTTKVFAGNGQKISPCKECLCELKKELTHYEKGSKSIYALTKDKIDTAIKHAKEVVANKSDEHQNPITYFHELIEFLRAYK